MRPCRLAVAAACSVALFAPAAGRADDGTDTLFRNGVDALAKGAHQEAIDDFEALSDRGFVHPDASFDRGLAYLMRVRAKADRPGDLGRAAAAFEEVLRLRPGDDEAARELDRVRREVTRRRARRGRDEVDVRPTLDRIVVGFASDAAWSALAIAASCLLGLGLALRRSSRVSLEVAASVIAPVGLLALLVLAPLAAHARWLREHTRSGVIVASDAPLLDEGGKPLDGPPIPEAANVETGARSGARVHVRWGAREGWIALSSVRLMPP